MGEQKVYTPKFYIGGEIKYSNQQNLLNIEFIFPLEKM